MLPIPNLPRWAWAALAGAALVLSAWAGVVAYGNGRYAAGRASVTATLAPSGVDTVVRVVERQAEAHTDTVVRRVLVTVRQVDTLVWAIPDTLLSEPRVKALAVTATTLAAQVDTLTRVIDTERAAHHLRAAVDSAQIVALKVTTSTLMAENRTLSRRPRWRTVALALVIGVVGGVLK